MTNTQNQKEGAYATLTGFKRAVPIILIAVAVFIAICFFTKNSTGAFGQIIGDFLLGSFSVGGYFIPALFAIHAFLYPSDVQKKRVIKRIVFSLLLLIFISAITHAFFNLGVEPTFDASRFYSEGKSIVGGGFVGGVIAFGITKVIGNVGLIILALTVIAICVTNFFSGDENPAKKFFTALIYAIVSLFAFIEEKIEKSGKNKKAEKDVRQTEKRVQKSIAQTRRAKKIAESKNEKEDKLFDDDYYTTDTSIRKLDIDELGISQTTRESDIEENPTLQDKVYPKKKVDEDDGYTPLRSAVFVSDYGQNAEDAGYTVSGNDYIYEPAAEEESAPVEVIASEPIQSDDAASVFSGSFNAYDLATNERLAAKASSRTATEVKKEEPAAPAPTQKAAPTAHTYSREEIELARLRADREEARKLKEEQERLKAEQERLAREFVPTTVEFDINPENAPKDEDETEELAVTESVTTDTPASYDAPAASNAGAESEQSGYVYSSAEEQPTYAPHTEQPTYAPQTEHPTYTPEPEQQPTAEVAYDDKYRRMAGFATSIIDTPKNDEAERQLAEARRRAEEAERRAEEAERLAAERIRQAEEAARAADEAARQSQMAAAAEPTYPRAEFVYDSQGESNVADDEPSLSAPENTVYDYADESPRTPTTISFTDDDDSVDNDENYGAVFAGDESEPVKDVESDYVYDSDNSVYAANEEEPDDEEDVYTQPAEDDGDEIESGFEAAPTVVDNENVDFDDEDEDDKYLHTYKDESDDELDYGDDLPFDSPTIRPGAASASSPTPPPTVPQESEKPDYSNFKLPPIDFLAKEEVAEEDVNEEITEYGDKLIDALAQFDVRASIRGVDRGPRITRYEIVPARGVRVNKVIGLFDDIALNLAVEGIRMEAPIPGKSAIGVELPNKHPSTVYLRDLLETEEFKNEKSKTFACVGKDVTGNPVFCDVAKMPHMLVAGATGMGKSVCINSILVSILYKARPDEVKFIMIDPKTVEFTMYNGIPHLLVPVVTDVKQAAGALMWAVDEMNRRYALLAKHEVRKLEPYNELVKAHPELGEPLPKIIIVIDELNDLMQQAKKPVESLITSITQKARAAGIHMIIGTQRPSVDVVTGVIKANIPSRIACKVTAFADSKTILDAAGAEKLLDKGDMLFAPVGKPKPIRVQGAFVADDEVERIMKYLKSTVKGAVYDEVAFAEMARAAQKCAKGDKDSDDFDGDGDDEGGEKTGYLNDKQFLEAVNLAIKQGKISTSLIQRKLSVGYGKAAKFIDVMEGLSIVSEPNGSKPRDVLVTADEWREILYRRSLDD